MNRGRFLNVYALTGLPRYWAERRLHLIKRSRLNSVEVSPAPAPATDRLRPEESVEERPAEWGKGTAAPELLRFLEGPQTRRFELGQATQIFTELIRGFRTLHFAG